MIVAVDCYNHLDGKLCFVIVKPSGEIRFAWAFEDLGETFYLLDGHGWHRNLPQDVRPKVTYFKSVKLPINLSKPKHVTTEQYKMCLYYFTGRVKPAQRLKILAHLMDTEQFDATDAMVEKALFLFY